MSTMSTPMPPINLNDVRNWIKSHSIRYFQWSLKGTQSPLTFFDVGDRVTLDEFPLTLAERVNVVNKLQFKQSPSYFLHFVVCDTSINQTCATFTFGYKKSDATSSQSFFLKDPNQKALRMLTIALG